MDGSRRVVDQFLTGGFISVNCIILRKPKVVLIKVFNGVSKKVLISSVTNPPLSFNVRPVDPYPSGIRRNSWRRYNILSKTFYRIQSPANTKTRQQNKKQRDNTPKFHFYCLKWTLVIGKSISIHHFLTRNSNVGGFV